MFIFASNFMNHQQLPLCIALNMLCASAYTAIDHVQFGMYKNKLYNYKNEQIKKTAQR